MKKIIIIISFLIYFMSAVANSQELDQVNEEQPAVKRKITSLWGASASSVSGLGLSCMYYITPAYHAKVTGIYYQRTDEKTNEDKQKAYNNTIFSSAGLEFRRNFAVINKTRVTYNFYTLAGGSYWYYKKERPFCPEDDKKWKVITGGIGLGTGFLFIDKISINFDLCYQYARGIDHRYRYAGPGAGASCYVAF